MDWQNIILDYPRVTSMMREVHTVPVSDSRMHTVPMCWCRPVERTHGAMIHNAVSVPD